MALMMASYFSSRRGRMVWYLEVGNQYCIERICTALNGRFIGKNGEFVIEAVKSYRHSTFEPHDKVANCAPENAINGYSRIVSAEEYEWVSDPAQALPQWLALDFAEPTAINSVSLAFNTDLTNPGTCWHPESKAEGVPVCVKDYAVEVFADGEWRTVADVEGNFQRKRTHGFAAVTAEKIRVTVKATWGDKSARIQEIRAALEQ